MIIKDFVENDDGSAEFKYSASPEEMAFLVSHAIHDLIIRGKIQVDTEMAEIELDLFKDDGGLVN